MPDNSTAGRIHAARQSRSGRAVGAIILVAAACSGADVTAPLGPTEIALSVASVTLRSLGESIDIVATVKDQDGAVYVATVTWSTADPNVATVSNSGSITAVGNGTASVTATSGSLSKQVSVTVRQEPGVVSVTPAQVSLTAIGAAATLTADAKDARGHVIVDMPASWTSSAPNIVTVAPNGIVTAVGNGTATVTATVGGMAGTSVVTVRQEASVLTVEPSSATLTSLGATTVLAARVKDDRGNAITDLQASWSSSTPAVATVVSNGTVTAVSNGTTVVTASIGSLTGTAMITVNQQPAQLTVSPPTVDMVLPGPAIPLTALVKDARGNTIPAAQVIWSSSNLTVAGVSAAGVVTGVSSGTATITARLGTLAASSIVTVRQDAAMVVEAIDPFLATPASNHQWEIPVLVIRYLPTTDGVTLDQRVTAYPFPAPNGIGARPAALSEVRTRINVFDRRVKFMLEEGSRFRGYANPQALPALGYRILHYITVYEALPLGRVAGPCPPNECTGNAYFPDYHAILARVNAQYWVNTKGVKEIWVWGYHYGNMVQPESNMSSPTTGDISNSFRWNDDLPIYNTTYTLYGYNYSRAQNEAVHNHGHQLEAILSYADQRQNGNTDLFWKSFVGQVNATTWGTGRAGWTHMPPNTTQHYDYLNPTPVLSDIEDWRPDNTGTRTSSGSNRWRSLVYNWPSGTVPIRDGWAEDFGQGSDQRTEAQWYIYWMQNMPGRGSAIPHLGGQMTNWWTFTANWDAAIAAGTGLSTVPNGFPIRILNDLPGQTFMEPGGYLGAGQTRTLFALAPITVSIWDCGEPGGCKMDPYVLTPGKNYRIIWHPSGPVNNLTIVEQ